MSVIRTSLMRQALAATAVAAAAIAAACSDSTAPASSRAASAAPTTARPTLAVGSNTIVFQRDSTGDVSSIYTMNDDGTNLTRLRAGERPAWSPDHSKIVFEANNTVFIMNADGTGARALTGVQNDHEPSFTPDGAKVVFAHENVKTHNFEIFAVNADGTNRQLLLKLGNTSVAAPSISPDGTMLAYHSTRRSEVDVMVMDLATGRRSIVAGGPNFQSFPVWSPDSKRLAFKTGQLDKGQCIGVVNADGTGMKLFTNDVGFCSTVSWSPDGKELAFTSTTPGTAGIYRAPVDTPASPTRLTTPSTSALDVKLSWSR
jgi:Tol biopolymer transport system component